MGGPKPGAFDRPPLQKLPPPLSDPLRRPGPYGTLPGTGLSWPAAQAMFGNRGVAALFGNRTPLAGPTPADGFKKEFENQYVPSEIKGRVDVATPSLQRGKIYPPVTLLFEVTVTPIGKDEPTTLYAIPESELFETEAAAQLPSGEDRDKQSLLGRSLRLPDLSTPPPGAARPPVDAGKPAAPPTTSTGPTRLYTRNGPVDVLARADGFGITGQYHKLAVGAASTTVAETPRGVILIDAGTAGGATGALANATIAKCERIVKGRPIVDVLLTHAHLDHTALLKRIFSVFEVLNLHLNLAQALQPGFKSGPAGEEKMVAFEEFKGELAGAQRALIEDKLRKEVAAERPAWESSHDIPQAAAREAQWHDHLEEQVAKRLAARQVLKVDLQVPGTAGQMHVVSAPFDAIDITKVEAAPGKTAGVVQGDQQSAIVNKNLSKAVERQQEKPGEIDVDRYSTSYVLIIDGKIMALVLPDLRVNDLFAIRDALKQEMKRLNPKSTVELRVWDIGHHLQRGFLGVSSPDPDVRAVLRATKLRELTNLLHELTSAKQAQGAQVADVVSVSVKASKVDPALKWVLKEMGFAVATAADGQDVRLIEAVTATGRRVKGLAGGRLEPVGSQADPLVRRAHAAMEELKQKAETARQRANKLRKKVDQPEKERLRAEEAEAKAKIKAISDKVDAYVKQADLDLTGGTGKALAGAPAEPAAAQATALRTELAGFDRPVVGRLGTFSDVAVVLLGGDIPQDAREDLRLLDEVRTLEGQVAAEKGAVSPELRARYTLALEKKRNLVRRRLAEADKQGPEAAEERKVLRDEVKFLDKQVEAAVGRTGSPGETQQIFKRRLPDGKLVETRIEAPKRPSALARGVNAGAEAFGRGMGAVMVYQIIKGDQELEERWARGEVNLLEQATTTVHNLHGLSVGARMMGGIHVAPGEFVVMAAVDIAQTAAREYDTTAQRNTAIAYSVIRNAVSLGLMTAGQFLIDTRHPLGVIAGLGIMFLADPILEALGVYEWLERKFEFLPDEVVAVTQKLRKALDEYKVIVGALAIARRDDRSLRSVGAASPAQARKAANELVDSRRQDAKRKESEVLLAFLGGYEVARDSYGGLPELDERRAEFLALMLQAQGEEAPGQPTDAERNAIVRAVAIESMVGGKDPGYTSRQKADAVFRWVEDDLSLEKKRSEQVAELGQWKKMDDWMDKVGYELGGKETNEVDWKEVAELVGQLDQMFVSARYRLRPSDSSAERVTPLLPQDSTARYFYTQELMKREKRFVYVRESLTAVSGGRKLPAGSTMIQRLIYSAHAFARSPPGVPDSSITTEAALTSTQAAIDSYRKALDQQPALGDGLTAESVGRHSWEAGTAYPLFVNRHDDYKRGLFRMKTLELAMRTSLGQALALGRTDGANVSQDQRERLSKLPVDARQLIEERREVKGFLFLDEAQARIGEIRVKENVELAALLGQPDKVDPLTQEEQAAAGEGALRDLHLTSINNRLAQIAQLRFPTPEEVRQGKTEVKGIFKVVGDYDYTDFLIFRTPGTHVEESDNVLVGFLREGGDTTSGQYGHTTYTFVVPLNDAAVRLFGGTGSVRILSNLLWPAKVDDIRKLR